MSNSANARSIVPRLERFEVELKREKDTRNTGRRMPKQHWHGFVSYDHDLSYIQSSASRHNAYLHYSIKIHNGYYALVIGCG